MSPKTAPYQLLLRPAIVVVTVSFVVAIIYYTPFPDIKNTYANCNRPCHELEWPMICRFKIIVEARRAPNRKSCDDCWRNVSSGSACTNNYCMIGDDSDRRIVTANKIFPGPSMHVCENDILVVEVVNRLVGHSVSLHWRGQPLQETPCMDGVAMVSQCPVSSHTTFQYKLRASQPGTHVWQAMTGDTETDDLFGALIVRRPNKMEPHRTLYDEDRTEHVILLSEWSAHRGQSTILINGRSNPIEDSLFPVQEYNVTKGVRYRFRVAYSTSHSGCPISAQISSHSLLLLALDGQPIEPKKVDSFTIVPGERIDFVLNADQAIKQYQMQFTTSEWCSKFRVTSHAVLKYNNSHPSEKTVTEMLRNKILTTAHDIDCSSPGTQCLSTLKSLVKLPDRLNGSKTDVILTFKLQERKFPPHQDLELEEEDSWELRSLNGIVFTFPSSPLLLRQDDDDRDPDDSPSESQICNQHKVPQTCSFEAEAASCRCTHVVPVPLMASVQITILNPGRIGKVSDGEDDPDYTFHLHGQSFHLIQRGQLDTLSNVSHGDFDSHFLQNSTPVLKDTVSVPRRSFATFRFIASNPGYWLLHEGRSEFWSRGMAVVLKVGERDDFPRVPDTFPTCGNWIGPEFFLA